ncbi:MAG: hypothetical protein ACREIV_00115, partial [Planctomycetaceae bacterium]
ATPTDADLTGQVSVEVTPSLNRIARGVYSVNVRVTNTSDEAIPGPLALVVLVTGVEGLTAESADGETADGEPYFELVRAERELTAGEESEPCKIRLRSPESLRREQREAFQLEYKIIRPTPQDVAAEDRPRDESRRDERAEPRPDGRMPLAGPSGRNGRTPRTGGESRADRDEDPDADPERPAQPDGPEKQPERNEYGGPPDEEVERVMKIQERYTERWLEMDGVIGTVTGMDKDGNAIIRVYLARAGGGKELPETIEGVAVETMVVGRFREFQPPQDKKGQVLPGLPFIPPDCPDDPTARFARPVPIGVSAFTDSGAGICAAGTLGCRVVGRLGSQHAGKLFVLSNNHVLAEENLAPIGSPVHQPSLGDFNCVSDPDNIVARLSDFEPINFFDVNIMDAAIAETTAELVSNRAACGALYGLPNEQTVQARLGLKVIKYGRTTRLRSGTVTGVNGISFVGYTTGPAFFINVIEITNPVDQITSPLGAPGDSGSLIVTSSGSHPIGLLFAGSALVTLANPIDPILDRFQVNIDGAPAPEPVP